MNYPLGRRENAYTENRPLELRPLRRQARDLPCRYRFWTMVEKMAIFPDWKAQVKHLKNMFSLFSPLPKQTQMMNL